MNTPANSLIHASSGGAIIRYVYDGEIMPVEDYRVRSIWSEKRVSLAKSLRIGHSAPIIPEAFVINATAVEGRV